MTIGDFQSRARVFLGVSSDNPQTAPSIRFKDEAGKERTIVGVADAGPSSAILDVGGRQSVAIGINRLTNRSETQVELFCDHLWYKPVEATIPNVRLNAGKENGEFVMEDSRCFPYLVPDASGASVALSEPEGWCPSITLRAPPHPSVEIMAADREGIIVRGRGVYSNKNFKFSTCMAIAGNDAKEIEKCYKK